MNDCVIRVQDLGKRFVIGHQRSGYLRYSFADGVRRLFGRRETREEFWALRDLSFDISRGDVVGIIGRNGAGKSTLLKVLSRITRPTTGRFEIDGRVSSLLEVGTGFHMELTGRENIFLNGTILGMRRSEIRSRFDEIVSFSGVEEFLDTPVKHYSSGMRVRLAFSVAAHLEPEILIVDEVLAVGDAEFQKKCLGKMGEVSEKEGRTILFVSHNMAAVKHLCRTAMLLTAGGIAAYGNVDAVVNNYLDMAESSLNAGGKHLREGVSIERFNIGESVESMGDVNYEIILSSKSLNRFSEMAILIYNDLQERIGIVDLRHKDLQEISAEKRELTIKGRISDLPLIEGTYHLGLFISSTLFCGDITDITRIVVNSRPVSFLPYARRHRGHLEFKNDFCIQ